MLGSVLITGGTGTYGRAFTRRLLADSLSDRVCILSRSEHAQAAMRQEFDDDPRIRFFIGDVRDQQRLRRAMTGVDVVVHAAALKRIETGFYNPTELIRTNVDGSINVVEAAQDAGVKKVVGLSSDKATEPIGAYGASKALMESLFIAANNTVPADGPRYSLCRYGNIFNSAGSLVPRWRAMIEGGAKAVPCTDPNCTRFYMEIDQAVDLVLETIETMRGGEVMIPDLPAFRIGDLAEAMGVKLIIKGLPSWEKMDESMLPGEPSDKARRMSVAELREKLREIGFEPRRVAA